MQISAEALRSEQKICAPHFEVQRLGHRLEAGVQELSDNFEKGFPEFDMSHAHH